MSLPRIVVAGLGHLGCYHMLKVLGSARATLVGLVEPDAGRAEAARARLRAAGLAEARIAAMPFAPGIAQLDVAADAAIVATPTTSHVEVGLACLARGWHVLIEKPLAPDAAAGERLVRAADAACRLLQVGHLERYNPAVVAAWRSAGVPRYIVAERLSPFTGRATDVDVVLDLMIHDLDLVAAQVPAALVEVRAVGVPVLTGTIDMASARLAFANGTVAQLSCGRTSLAPTRKLRLFSPQGYVSVDMVARTAHQVRRLPADAGAYPNIVGEALAVGPGDPLGAQDEAFFASVAAGSAPQVDGAAGVRALRMAEAVKAAIAAAPAWDDPACIQAPSAAADVPHDAASSGALWTPGRRPYGSGAAASGQSAASSRSPGAGPHSAQLGTGAGMPAP